MQKRVIIFSGYNQRAVLALLRTMEQLKLSYCIIASSKEDSIFDTTYAKKVFATRVNLRLDIEEFVPFFERISESFQGEEFVIAPSTESLNRLFLRNRNLLEQYRMVLPLVEEGLYAQISDKICFNKMCQEYAIKVPQKYQYMDELPKRFVAKPKHIYSEITNRFLSPIIVEDEQQYNQFFQEYCPEDFFFEEYIEGESYYLLYYFFKDKTSIKFSQKNLLQQGEGKSIVLAKAAKIHMEPIADKFEALFMDSSFRGLVMVEIRKCNGEYYMIEANPRMWGPSQLAVDSGVNFLHAFLYDWGITEIPVEITKANFDATYCWGGGMKEDLVKGRQMVAFTDETMTIEQFWQYLRSDVYCRDDSIEIFCKE